jgi:hypothetical protein
LVQWFGVSAANILPIFPSLANFTPQNLGFLTPTDRLPRLRITSYPVSPLRERVGPFVLWPGPKSKMSDIIVVQDLVKNYGDFCAVNHIWFTVPEGTIFGFLGPNGAGKTTKNARNANAKQLRAAHASRGVRFADWARVRRRVQG